ncbi:hypothetical protein HETIRDRAFT_441698 [Heterobasidion irregulare TC 32-1]|uniref:Ketoreductase domain-containing protein n=1 Tax=Heterobasidion irregulare (strain TC 32-1) TaxID=747525 RepID=W4JVP5_HETIT|nr:uncharacterized protein HETIRDRAFT_441698 [Heterobasidion irregulare TC 32-1]ETW77150.1 hypothetical protein HETIRDRAFT_441698 [Heterobasidion irregulare TC 32-1]
MPAPAEDLPVTLKHDVYPTIDPSVHYDKKSCKGKVVFVAGASRGIGEEIAITYARAGASVVLGGRKQATLDAVKKTILESVDGVQVLDVILDVTKAKQVDDAVKVVIAQFGKLDIVIANAGALTTWNQPFTEEDPDAWWNVLEVNVRGVYNVARYTTPHLSKTRGYFVAISSLAAQIRIPFGSSYAVSKHAVGRFVEHMKLETPEIKVFSLHPGSIKTDLAMQNPQFERAMVDTTQLAAATALYLTAGNADWLSGRFVSSNWDLKEVEEKWKGRILEHEALVSRLSIPL